MTETLSRSSERLFSKSVTYDNIKSHSKKQGFTISLEDAFFKKPHGESQIDPQPVLGLRSLITYVHGAVFLSFVVTKSHSDQSGT